MILSNLIQYDLIWINNSYFVKAANKKQDMVTTVLCDQLLSDTGCPKLKCILSIGNLIQYYLIWFNSFCFVKAAKKKQDAVTRLCDQLLVIT